MKAKKTSAVTLSDEQFHAIARALSDPRRMAIFQQIAAADGISCSCLREHQVISPATISHHMKELNEAGLVAMERKGREAHLTLCRPTFQAYVDRLASLAKL
jgi:ArsR family transcriptional regulator, arsenate/arsenite/antimonite-responsive transcriptional repressor